MIYEPELTSALTGITRSSVIELAGDLFKMPVKAKRLTRDDIYIADECFFTGTAAEVTPIRELDSAEIGAGKAGPDHQGAAEGVLRRGHRQGPQDKAWLTPVAR